MAQGGKAPDTLVRLIEDQVRSFHPDLNQLVPVLDGHLEPVPPPDQPIALRPDERHQVINIYSTYLSITV